MPADALPLNWRKYPERYRLLGTHCEECGKDFFPPRAICPHCRRGGKLSSREMPRNGKILYSTKVFVGPSGFEFETPYHLAFIELANKARILAQIVDSEEEDIKKGAKVRLAFRKIADPDPEGPIAYGYKFQVVK